jgi:DNA-binding LacI/PurR family transcriptional regulator
VSAAARAAVQRAVKELGYAPNQAARSLVTRKHDAVALVASEWDERLFLEPFFAEVVLGVNSGLAESDLDLVLVVGTTERQRERFAQRLRARTYDGLMLLSLQGVERVQELVESTGVPAVFCGRPLGVVPAHYVDSDNRAGARLAAEHLVRIGRRRIATITGALDKQVGVDRHAGFVDGMLAAGLPADLMVEGSFTEASGARAMTALLDEHPDLDAVFVAGDSMAFGALRVLRARGLSVPGDVAVVGFDDLARAALTEPPLTTVRQEARGLGIELARALLGLMRGDEVQSLILPTSLVVRDSA